MSGVLAILLGVALLATEKPVSAKVTSRSADFDGAEGVVMFEGDVVVHYSNDLTMCADKLYMFVVRSNELSRVVALGNVSITNDLRYGTCDRAIYRRVRDEIEMFGDGAAKKAVLMEHGESARSLEGTQIRFWLDSEQVEVRNAKITSEIENRGDLL